MPERSWVRPWLWELQFSAQRIEDLLGSLVAQHLSRPGVEEPLDPAQISSSQIRQVCALGEVAAHESVGVLVGGPLPGAVGIAEEDVNTQGCGQLLVPCHLGAAVVGQGAKHGAGDLTQPALEAGQGTGGRAVIELDEQDPAAGAFDQGADGGLATGALDEVTLPVPRLKAIEHVRGAHADGRDVLQTCEASSATLLSKRLGAPPCVELCRGVGGAISLVASDAAVARRCSC